MIDAPLTWAFTVGMVAVVNPCGFPMLPAYLSYFVGVDDDATDRAGRVPRAVLAAAAVAAGFLAVFAALGLPINAGLSSIYRWVPWLTIVIGFVLAGLGLAMLLGYRMKLALPRLDRGGRGRGVRSMALFGASYAIASLSCSLPIFLAVVGGTAERSNLLSGVVAFGAFGLGLVTVLMAVSVALALARESLVRRLRSVLRHVDRVSAVLLVLVGGYLVYYGVRARNPDLAASSPVSAVERLSADLTAWFSQGGVALGLLLGSIVVAAVAVSLLAAGRRLRGPAAPGASPRPHG